MGISLRRFIYRGLLLLLMLLMSAAGALAGEVRDEFTWNYWGTPEHDFHVYGDTLSSPELELNGESISFADVTFEEDQGSGFGIYFYGDWDQPEITDASVVLDSGANIEVALTLADSSVEQIGRAHV